jgi:hypothetical protein
MLWGPYSGSRNPDLAGNLLQQLFITEALTLTFNKGSTPQNRDDRIRTCDILLPKQARYQAALHRNDALQSYHGATLQ